MRIGLEKGLGCYAEKLPDSERTQTRVPDQFRHEIATAFNLKGKGLVLLTSCSHRGVVNAVKEARAVSGVEKVHAVIGGFHLAPYPPEYVQQTVAALKELNIEHIIPLHCTGEPFYDLARTELPGKVLRSYTGTRFVFA
jgi:7,8-dihydropterin-6-yl-methyl-4-(beta-D-ribofuranosyl)aminobenzene 5'-phosphate synthase